MEAKELKRAKTLIYVASVAVPLVVALLLVVPPIENEAFKILPPIYATINGITALLLLFALVAIKQKKVELHRKLIRFSLLLSLLFLACYVAYHLTSESTAMPDTVSYKPVYLILLLTHILLSVVVIPLVLFTYLFAWQGDFQRHKKWTRFTWPIWFYVAVSGVAVYLMISPYYG
jgi:putative membrane protein